VGRSVTHRDGDLDTVLLDAKWHQRKTYAGFFQFLHEGARYGSSRIGYKYRHLGRIGAHEKRLFGRGIAATDHADALVQSFLAIADRAEPDNAATNAIRHTFDPRLLVD
jgi:hypothetical protein